MKLENKELLTITGGAISGALLSSIIKGITSVLEVGRSLGTALRMLFSGRKC